MQELVSPVGQHQGLAIPDEVELRAELVEEQLKLVSHPSDCQLLIKFLLGLQLGF
uniref:Uncharacterized protein n=1 Tax=Arundo donax TaxID=35708 RepID=A0A0A8ZDB0_ARUDO